MPSPGNSYGRFDPVPVLAAVAFLLAAVAVALGAVALGKSDDEQAGDDMAMGAMGQMGSMEHMAPLSIDGITKASANRGGTRLVGKQRDGATEYELEAKPVWWNILDDQRVAAWSYNGIVPGPEIRARNGERVRVKFTNELPEETTVHWHGVGVPNSQDGVPGVTQEPIEPGDAKTYEFVARPAGDPDGGGTFLYHSHVEEDRQMPAGLYGALVIEPRERSSTPPKERTIVVSEWTVNPATGRTRGVMPMEGMMPNFFTINGKSYPDTEKLRVRAGERVRLRLINAGQFAHPLHLHGTAFEVVARDGHPTRNSSLRDTLSLESGERADVEFELPRGKWIFHCHIGHHVTNDGEGPGGLLMVVEAT